MRIPSSLGRKFGLLALLCAALLAGEPLPAHAARSQGEQLQDVGSQLRQVEATMSQLQLDFTQRRGLIGASEARQRYEDAVYAYLVGDYEPAALTFFALVESEALATEALDLDSEWYLAECLFEMENYTTALDAYERIVTAGKGHPFFVDAVRRELEIYGILQDHERFQDLYKRYVLSGMVPTTDAIKYTVAKSFYRQGSENYARAKGMLTELPPESEWYSRARYFLGAILSAEGDYASALAEFQRAASAEATTSATREVQELSWLALGRLNYELGNYDAAVESYQKISSESTYYADQLYEMAWTYVKQENWNQALRTIEMFLLSFPEHRYTMQMKLTEGHLHMKEESYEKALVSYETVVDAYTPIQERLAQLEGQRDSAAQVFARMSENQAFDTSVGLPIFAVEMLTDGDGVARAVQANQDLTAQRQDTAANREVLTEVETALANSTDGIGTFARGREQLDLVSDQALALQASVVGLELDYLLANAPERYRPELRTLQERYVVLTGAAEDVQGEQTADTDRYEAHQDQVREVQTMAFQVQQVTIDLAAQATALRRQLADASLSARDRGFVEANLKDVEDDLSSARARLEALQSETTRRQVMRSVLRTEDGGDERRLLARDYAEMHKLLGTYWGRTDAADKGQVQGQVDDLWSRLLAVERAAADTLAHLDDAEQSELDIVRRTLMAEKGNVGAMETEIAATTADASALAARITQEEFSRLRAEFTDTIMRADVGIVDVYWIRKTDVSDEAERLRAERAAKLEELDARFKVIHQKLESGTEEEEEQ